VKPFDERLFQLKMQPINQRMHGEAGKCMGRARAEVQRLGNHARLLPAFVECQLEVLRKHLEEIYMLRREVWLLDGNTVTPEFIRNIVVPHAFTVIAARKGAIQHELDLFAMRTGEHQRGGHILVHQINHLLGEVANRYEIDAIELEKQAVRRIPTTSANSVVLAVHSPSEPGNKPEDVNLSSVKAETWRDFREKFQALASEEQGRTAAITEGKALRGMEQVLRASCNYKEHPEGWERGKPGQGRICLLETPPHGVWNYSSDGISENFRERVRLCVAEAGHALADYPKGTDAEDFWLHRLYLDLMKNNSDQLFAASKEGGMVISVCVASATFCARLERKALEQSRPIKRSGGEGLRTGANQAVSSGVQNSTNSAEDVETDSTDRRAMVRAYIEEVRSKTGKRITMKDIWSRAGYQTRTEFERWQRRDLKHTNQAADRNFTRILREKPHLK
jgi:hypothetical protein